MGKSIISGIQVSILRLIKYGSKLEGLLKVFFWNCLGRKRWAGENDYNLPCCIPLQKETTNCSYLQVNCSYNESGYSAEAKNDWGGKKPWTSSSPTSSYSAQGLLKHAAEGQVLNIYKDGDSSTSPGNLFSVQLVFSHN